MPSFVNVIDKYILNKALYAILLTVELRILFLVEKNTHMVECKKAISVSANVYNYGIIWLRQNKCKKALFRQNIRPYICYHSLVTLNV